MFIYFSDLHVHNYQRFNEVRNRLENSLAVLDYIFEVANENIIDEIVFGGDLFHTQQIIPTIVGEALIRRFRDLFTKYPQISFYAISGNHDFATNNTYQNPGISALQILVNSFPGRFFLMDNKYAEIDEFVIHGIPYYRDVQDFKNAVDDVIMNGCDHNILLIHQTPKVNEIFQSDFEVNDKIFDPYEYVLCGHIHERNLFNNKFLIAGSPIHQTASDIGIEKGFYFISETGINFMEIGHFPKFKYGEPDGRNFCIPIINTEIPINTDSSISFDSKLPIEELLKNYWLEVDGKNKDLLSVGLAICKK